MRTAFDKQQQVQAIAIAQTLARVTSFDFADGDVRRDKIACHTVTPTVTRLCRYVGM
jgi:hypothetical protein